MISPPPPKPDTRMEWKDSDPYVFEAPIHTGEIKRNELAGPAVSRPDLKGSNFFTMSLEIEKNISEPHSVFRPTQ